MFYRGTRVAKKPEHSELARFFATRVPGERFEADMMLVL